MAQFSRPDETDYLTGILEGRLEKILERYLLKLSPLTDVRVSGSELCAVDLAEERGLRPAEAFRYTARKMGQGWLEVHRSPGAIVCTTLAHASFPSGLADNDASRYVRVVVRDGVASGALVAHLYDLGAERGFALVGLERPESDDEP
jgi:hypothetical protein